MPVRGAGIGCLRVGGPEPDDGTGGKGADLKPHRNTEQPFSINQKSRHLYFNF